jgi:hypothetical protein
VLRQARPIAVNLAWAIERLLRVLRPLAPLARRVAPTSTTGIGSADGQVIHRARSKRRVRKGNRQGVVSTHWERSDHEA